jgi:rubrerythrin
MINSYDVSSGVVPDHIFHDAFVEPKVEVCEVCGTELDEDGKCPNCIECEDPYKMD